MLRSTIQTQQSYIPEVLPGSFDEKNSPFVAFEVPRQQKTDPKQTEIKSVLKNTTTMQREKTNQNSLKPPLMTLKNKHAHSSVSVGRKDQKTAPTLELIEQKSSEVSILNNIALLCLTIC